MTEQTIKQEETKIIDINLELHNICDKYSVIGIQEEKIDTDSKSYFRIKFTNRLDTESLNKFLEELYTFESELSKRQANTILFDLRGLDIEFLADIIRISLKKEDLSDALMLLNIINLIKVFNTLDDAFFNNKDIYVTDVENFIDLRYELKTELDDFIKQLSIYFLSLFKSYNKTTYTPQDKHKPLPKIIKNIILSTDLLTLSGIFSIAKPFNTSECMYIDDAIECLTVLQNKSTLSNMLLNEFLKGI